MCDGTHSLIDSSLPDNHSNSFQVAIRVTRHPTGIADSTLPSLWSNADFRRANIDTLRQRLHNPLPRGGVAAEQVVSALAVEGIDVLHSTAAGRVFAWLIGGRVPAGVPGLRFDRRWG